MKMNLTRIDVQLCARVYSECCSSGEHGGGTDSEVVVTRQSSLKWSLVAPPRAFALCYRYTRSTYHHPAFN